MKVSAKRLKDAGDRVVRHRDGGRTYLARVRLTGPEVDAMMRSDIVTEFLDKPRDPIADVIKETLAHQLTDDMSGGRF